MKKLYLVDVSSMFFRAFYAVRPLTSPTGMPVNAIYGFMSMVVKLIKDEKPEYMVFCYDRKEPSFRKEMYDDYKAHRTEMPEDLAKQIPSIKKIADLLGIPSLEVPSYEADDLIGTLASVGRQQGCEVIIVSGDKDFGQLVGDHVVLYDTMKDVRYDSAGVKEKWGIVPAQVIDYLALVGDSSDNIPGVTGIGPKGAIKLLEQFSSLEEVYAHLDQIDSKSIRGKLEASRDMAFLSKKLVTIVRDVPVSTNLADYRLKPFLREDLRAFLQELNFKTFEKSLLGEVNGAAVASAGGTGKTAAAPAEEMTASSVFASEAPTPAATAPTNEVGKESVSMTVEEREVRTLSAADLIAQLKPQQEVWGFSDSRGLFVATDKDLFALEGDATAFGPLADQKKLRWNGFDLKEFWHKIDSQKPELIWDSMLAAYVVEAGDTNDFAKVLKMYTDATLPDLASPSLLLHLHQQLQGILARRLSERQVGRVYRQLELPLEPVLLQMEKAGIRIDVPFLKKQSEALATDLAVLEREVHDLAGESFNVGSPKQLGHILFEKLGLEATKKTKTGFSTDTDVLEKMTHPIAQKVLQWRELSKLKSTYVDALPELTDGDGRVHTHFNQALTATGRLSSTQPNLQNIPIRTERGQQVRRAFIAAPGMKLLSVDYSQIELRILAHISEDPGLTRAFIEGHDIHTATAAEVYNIPLKDVTSQMRRMAKAVNFGIAYGQGAFGLAENLGIPRGEAQEIIKRYFEKFKGVQSYIESTTKTAYEKGYVETLFGRRRYIPELSAKNGMLRKFGERAAINAPIQGTASDLVKIAMIRLAQAVPVPMLLQVHDELIFEASESTLKEHLPRILEVMEGVASFRIPLKANAAIGDNWDEAH